MESFDINNPDHLDRTKYRVIKWESSGRRPSNVSFCESFKEDAARRDFSFNALALSATGEVIDYFNGKEDLDKCIVKAIGCPYDRFGEDILRIIRMIRFSAKFNFDIDKCTAIAAEDCSEFLFKISIERISDELFKMASLGGQKFAKAIELLEDFGILKNILPEISCMKDYYHAPCHHPEGARVVDRNTGDEYEYIYNGYYDPEVYDIYNGSVWDHTIEALKISTSNDPEINLAILFHDIGKPPCFKPKYDEVKKITKLTYHGHDNVGVKFFNVVSKRFKFSNDFTEKVNFCIENHMKLHKFIEMKASKIEPIINNKNWEVLKYVSRCDDLSRRDPNSYKNWNEVELKINKLKENMKANEDSFKFINGDVIMKITGLKSGPNIGKIIKYVKENVIDNNIFDENEIKKLILKVQKNI